MFKFVFKKVEEIKKLEVNMRENRFRVGNSNRLIRLDECDKLIQCDLNEKQNDETKANKKMGINSTNSITRRSA